MIIKSIVYEKEQRLKETMRVMGLGRQMQPLETPFEMPKKNNYRVTEHLLALHFLTSKYEVEELQVIELGRYSIRPPTGVTFHTTFTCLKCWASPFRK